MSRDPTDTAPTAAVVDLLAIRARAEAAKNSPDRSHIWEDRRDVPALLALVDSLMVERDLARDVAANLEAEAAQLWKLAERAINHPAPRSVGHANAVTELRVFLKDSVRPFWGV